jgi:GNAT superfamily N-acetyltransferase/SAM-dependent methyltransferase
MVKNYEVNMDISYNTDSTGSSSIWNHLSRVGHLNRKTPGEVSDYVKKIETQARRFEAWHEGNLVGLVAAYFNAETGVAFITNVSVEPKYQDRGIGTKLLGRCLDAARVANLNTAELEAAVDNVDALRLYEHFGFNGIWVAKPVPNWKTMTMPLQPTRRRREFSADLHLASVVGTKERDFDAELPSTMPIRDLGVRQIRFNDGVTIGKRDFDAELKDGAAKYAYDFDTEVMHGFMMRAFEPWFIEWYLCLELGSFNGAFTRRLVQHFGNRVTCIEASSNAVAAAECSFGGKERKNLGARFINATFESAKLAQQYSNIFMIHTLEHVDDPVLVLRRINDEWLAPGGRLFLACPNANAASRQIAVKMGLIPHCAAVTDAERVHGHRRTYSLDTLEQDAKLAGLRVIHRGGIFFKGLANFQFDAAIKAGIISPEYLEGCYQLGQVYPDLCASIFLVCEKGETK